MSDDLVARLKGLMLSPWQDWPGIGDEAAAEIERLQAALRALASRTIALAEDAADKSEPWDHPHNRKLLERGDTILVNEGDLWALLSASRAALRGEVEK